MEQNHKLALIRETFLFFGLFVACLLTANSKLKKNTKYLAHAVVQEPIF